MNISRSALLAGLFVFICISSWTYSARSTEKERKEYYKDGTLKATYPYDGAGSLNGIVRTYYSDGILRSEEPYYNALLNGKGRL